MRLLSILTITLISFYNYAQKPASWEHEKIEVVYKKDVMVNEVSGEAKEFVDVDKIQIIFTDTDYKFKKIEFILGEKI